MGESFPEELIKVTMQVWHGFSGSNLIVFMALVPCTMLDLPLFLCVGSWALAAINMNLSHLS